MMTAAMTGWPELDAAVLAGKANLLGAGFLTLQAELGPGGIDQLNLLLRRLGGGSASRWRGLRSRCPGGSLRSGLRRSRLRRRLRARRRRGLGSRQGAGARLLGLAPEAIKPATAPSASKAKNCPCGRNEAAKIRKFIAENPF